MEVSVLRLKKLLVVADKVVEKLKWDMRVRLEWRNGVFCALHFLIIASIGLIKDCEKTTKKYLICKGNSKKLLQKPILCVIIIITT
jgi:hypothetical protein